MKKTAEIKKIWTCKQFMLFLTALHELFTHSRGKTSPRGRLQTEAYYKQVGALWQQLKQAAWCGTDQSILKKKKSTPARCTHSNKAGNMMHAVWTYMCTRGKENVTKQWCDVCISCVHLQQNQLVACCQDLYAHSKQPHMLTKGGKVYLLSI